MLRIMEGIERYNLAATVKSTKSEERNLDNAVAVCHPSSNKSNPYA